jgi:acyl-CoA thioesterase-1
MRKVHLSLIVLSLWATLAGCHSGPAPEAKPTQALTSERSAAEQQDSTAVASDIGARRSISKPANDKRPVLVCFGDSLTAGPGTDPGQSYPDYMQKDLDRLGYHYRVVNEGVSGNTTKDGVDRLPELLALHPAVVVVEFGGNDGLRGLPISESRRNLDTIVGTLKKAGVTVAIAGITLPPNYGEDYIRQFDETYSLLAKKYRVPMLPFLLQNVYGGEGMMQQDGIHATAKGNQIVAANVLKLVQPLLKK